MRSLNTNKPIDKTFIQDGGRESDLTKLGLEQRVKELENLLQPFKKFSSNQLYEMYDEYCRRQLTSEVAGGQFACGVENRTTVQSTGDLVITCDFLPKMIKIFSFGDASGGNTGWSQGQASTITDSRCMSYAYSGTKWEKLYSDTKILFVWDSGETVSTQASVSAISNTGFTLTFSTVGINTRLQWEAYG